MHPLKVMLDQQKQSHVLMSNLGLIKLLVLSEFWFPRIFGSSYMKMLLQLNLMICRGAQLFLLTLNNVLNAVMIYLKRQSRRTL